MERRNFGQQVQALSWTLENSVSDAGPAEAQRHKFRPLLWVCDRIVTRINGVPVGSRWLTHPTSCREGVRLFEILWEPLRGRDIISMD